jgi:ATP-dependent helicase HrpA
MARARALEEAFTKARDALPAERRGAPEVVELAWLLEELRVSLFAQKLGTARPVSEPRVRRAIAALEAGQVGRSRQPTRGNLA